MSKLNPAGTALVYSTYLGGRSFEQGAGIAVDAAGNAYVTGLTESTDFPTTPGAFQPTFGGGFDAFVSKLNATGTALVYSTFLGGSAGDSGAGIAVDAAGHPYVVGDAGSANFPTTPGAFQAHGTGSGIFVARLSPGPPACEVQALLSGPPIQLQVLVHADQGLTRLTVTQASNVSVALPPFSPGSTDTFMVTATKVDQFAKTTFTLRATDQTGSSTECDPALVTVGRATDDTPAQVIHHVVRAESHVTISNGTPGVQSLRLLVNGHRFEATALHAGEQRRLDVSAAMRQGSDNTILVIAHGPRNSSALLVVSDS